MQMPINLMPQDFIDLYGLQVKDKSGHVYMEIRRRIYELLQWGILANKLLNEPLAVDG